MPDPSDDLWLGLLNGGADAEEQGEKERGDGFHENGVWRGVEVNAASSTQAGNKGRCICRSTGGGSSGTNGSRKRSVLGAISGFAKSEISQPARETLVRPRA